MKTVIPADAELVKLAPAEKARIALSIYDDEIKPAIANLNAAILNNDIGLPVYTAKMPFPFKGECVPMLLEPESLTGEQARAYIAEIIALTTFSDDQDPRQAIRAPGLIAASEETLALVVSVNQAKDRFHSVVQCVSAKAWERKQEMTKVIPFLSQMQTFRKITALAVRPEKVSFTWSANSPSMSTLTAQQALKRIDAMKEDVPPMDVTQDRWLAMCDEYKQIIVRNNIPPNEILVFRRQAAPHPRVNIYFSEVEKPTMKKASMPIFYPHGGDLPPVNRLRVLDRTFRRSQRSDVKVEAEALVDGIDLYRYLEPHRKQTKGVDC